jgi:hypothetical protein
MYSHKGDLDLMLIVLKLQKYRHRHIHVISMGTTAVESPIRLFGYDQEIIPERREIQRPEHWLPG